MLVVLFRASFFFCRVKSDRPFVVFIIRMSTSILCFFSAWYFRVERCIAAVFAVVLSCADVNRAVRREWE